MIGSSTRVQGGFGGPWFRTAGRQIKEMNVPLRSFGPAAPSYRALSSIRMVIRLTPATASRAQGPVIASIFRKLRTHGKQNGSTFLVWLLSFHIQAFFAPHFLVLN